MNRTFKLLSDTGKVSNVEFHTEQTPFRVEDILHAQTKVFEDVNYSLQVEDAEPICNAIVYINGEKIPSIYKGNMIYLGDSDEPIFSKIIGFAQIVMCITRMNGTLDWYYSEYLKVLIKSSSTNRKIDSIFKYVYENQSDIMTNIGQVAVLGDGQNNVYGDFWSQIILLEEIVSVYEDTFGFFKANCRYKLEHTYVLDGVEKMQYADSKTLQYIVQHPEYLRRARTGISHGRQFFIPEKTLVQKNSITYDLYENQIVYAFIEYTAKTICTLETKIKEYLEIIQSDAESQDGYIVSSHLLYLNALDILREFQGKVVVLKEKIDRLVIYYSQIFSLKKKIVFDKPPEPTSIFLRVPQYNRIYECIIRCCRKNGYDLTNERIMLSYTNAPEIYEVYVLIKLINHIKECGFELVESKQVYYPGKANRINKDKEYKNTFVFKNDTAEMVLYYEPIIYDEDQGRINGIHLYRNTTVSLDRESEEERKGHYYVPDYLIKYSEGGIERYIICDAKFSRMSKVKNKLLPDLIYKYLTSISPIEENATIKGLYVICGLNEDYDTKKVTFYDRQIRDSKKITPYIELVPLSEDITYSEQLSNSLDMLRTIILSR